MITLACALVNCRDHDTRAFGFAPGPLLLNSAYRAVFSRAGRFQFCHPSERTTSDISVFRKITFEKSRHGRPRNVFTSASPVILHRENTKPYGS